jgi:hypothetical protein
MNDPQWVSAISSAVSAICTAILVFITGIYAWLTHQMVKSSEANNRLLREQIERQSGAGKAVIAQAVVEALDNIQRLEDFNFINAVYIGALPDNSPLLPSQWESAQSHASFLLTQELRQLLHSGFNELKQVQSVFERVRNVKSQSGTFANRENEAFQAHLAKAKELLTELQQKLPS